MKFLFAYLYWNPDRVLFTIPYFEFDVMIYGALFALGFLSSYFLLIYIFKSAFDRQGIPNSHVVSWEALTAACRQPLISQQISHEMQKKLSENTLSPKDRGRLLRELSHHLSRKEIEKLCPEGVADSSAISRELVDSLLWYCVIAVIVGARLGNVLFYDLPYFLQHPLQILNLRQGGLASHGGAVALLIALYLYLRNKRDLLPCHSYIGLLDLFAMVTPVTGFFIRIGNFFNQEILGTETTMPWGVVFGHPIDRLPVVPRHPVQLYEASCYLAISVFVIALWKIRGASLRQGVPSGLVFLLVFSSRFVLEFFKVQQTHLEVDSVIKMGQLLSIPFILLGLGLIFYGRRSKPTTPVTNNFC